MSKKTINYEPLYVEKYRGIFFYKTYAKFWIFEQRVPNNPGCYWTRFMTQKESEVLKNGVLKEQIKLMKKTIDRAYDNNIVYSGDIRNF
jgi:hypothetical protein